MEKFREFVFLLIDFNQSSRALINEVEIITLRYHWYDRSQNNIRPQK